MQAALRRYPVYLFFRNGALWLPIFFLWFLECLDGDISAALQVSSVYWISVVFLEVPSGYIADRLGRRGTLVGAALFGIAGNAAYATATGAPGLIMGQMLFAASSAFASGADTAWLYDTLKAAGQEADHAGVEARAQSWGFAGYAVSAALGGLIGGWSLPAVYWAAAVSQVIALFLAAGLGEPPAKRTTEAFLPQLAACVQLARRPVLAWAIWIAVAGMVFSHIPLEFMQPYWQLASGSKEQAAPIVIGALMCCTMLLAAGASRSVPMLLRRVAPPAILLATIGMQVALVACFASALHWAIGLLFLTRSVSMALQQPVVRSVAHGFVSSERRATLISVIALAGNLAFGGYLWIVGAIIGGGTAASWAVLQPTLGWSAALGGAVLAALAWGWVAAQRMGEP
jgi:hypothetical protein